MLERYVIIERMAVGGMGEVFLARQEGLGGFRRTVVIKKLLPDVEGSEDAARRLLDEARIVAALSHENVVRIIEVGEEDGAPIMALEYVHGENAGTLRTRAVKRSSPIPIAACARIVADAARGLHHAHTATDVEGRPLKVVHRDVAPKNIFVGVDGHSKIGDFGIATAAERLARTATGAVTGTLSYMSPEQLSSKPLGPPSDQWSLGVVLWELLTGQRLFKADGPAEVMEGILHRRLRSPRRLREGIPRELSDITKTMLERDPAARFGTLEAVANAIEGAVPGCVGALGQASVAAFVETWAGDDLRDRLRRIEEGSDVTRADRPPSLTSQSGKSGKSGKSGSSPSNRFQPISGSQATPRGQFPLPPGTDGQPLSNSGLTMTVPEGALARPSSRSASGLAGSSRSRRTLVAAVVGIAALVAVGGTVWWRSRPPDPGALTVKALERARPGRALVLREELLEEAKDRGIPEVRVDGAAVELAGLCNDRLDLLLEHWRQPADVRLARSQAFSQAEQALEDRTRNRLDALLSGLEPAFISETLDLWAEECWAPVRWLAPGPIVEVQANVQERIIPQIEDTQAWREAVVRRLLKRADANIDDVMGSLWPMVTERQAVIARYGRVPASDLDDVREKIRTIERTGRAMLLARLPSSYANAVAQVAFIDFDMHEAWVPLYSYLPSVKAKEPGGR